MTALAFNRPIPTRYQIVPIDRKAHLYRVQCELESANPEGQQFFMPCWVRGSYRIRDFPRHVVTISAYDRNGPLTIERLDKGRLRCAPCIGSLILDYTIYCLDASVRAAWLDCMRGFFNGAALLYAPEGLREEPFRVTVERPSDGDASEWRVFTAMTPISIDQDGFGSYFAPDYETLIDHPFEMGPHHQINFQVDDIPHSLVLTRRCSVDAERLENDLGLLCKAQHSLFGRETSNSHGLERYLFLCNVRAEGFGGLEHRSSSAITCSRDALPRIEERGFKSSYCRFLGLASHEYFHLWNGKRITPARLAESDLSSEAYTRDLWAVEGITTYYGDLMLLRAGLIDVPAYLDLISKTASHVEQQPGHHVQTLSDASFEAWIKHYQPDANTINASANYYSKGALVALCLDLTLRLHSESTLDDVMRFLWSSYGMTGKKVPEGGLETAATECSGIDLSSFFDHTLRSTKPLPLANLLSKFGVTAELGVQPIISNNRSLNEKGSYAPKNIELGMHVGKHDGVVKRIQSGSAGELAGLQVGDILVALDGWRLTPGNWESLAASLTLGRQYKVHYFRDEELFETAIKPAPAAADTWKFSLNDEDEEVVMRRRQWLGA